jgi:hypothetical protein
MDIYLPEGISLINISAPRAERLTRSVRCPGDGHEELPLEGIAHKDAVGPNITKGESEWTYIGTGPCRNQHNQHLSTEG